MFALRIQIILVSFLIFLITFCYSQTNSNDIYFLDMGIAIEPKNVVEKTAGLIKPGLSVSNQNMVSTKSSNGVSQQNSTEKKRTDPAGLPPPLPDPPHPRHQFWIFWAAVGVDTRVGYYFKNDQR